MYYVYEWYIIETGEIIYVGKGIKNRYKVRKHNKFFNYMIQRYDCKSRIIKYFESEKEAFLYEYDRINELKASNQCVCNIHSGGYGGTTEWWTDELREKYATNNVMKSEAQRKRMSENNPMKDPKVAEKTNSQKKIPIIVGDMEYPSIKAVCEYYKVSPATVNGWCVRGATSNDIPCYYKDDPHGIEYPLGSSGVAKPVMYKGIEYKSSGELARNIGVAQTTAARWCRQGRDSLGNKCYYIGTETNYIDCHISQKSIPIIINGKKYASKEEASRELHISSYILTQYLEGKKHSSDFICKYDNQQPSQVNFDNSNLEGSTTNG